MTTREPAAPYIPTGIDVYSSSSSGSCQNARFQARSTAYSGGDRRRRHRHRMSVLHDDADRWCPERECRHRGQGCVTPAPRGRQARPAGSGLSSDRLLRTSPIGRGRNLLVPRCGPRRSPRAPHSQNLSEPATTRGRSRQSSRPRTIRGKRRA